MLMWVLGGGERGTCGRKYVARIRNDLTDVRHQRTPFTPTLSGLEY